MDKRGHITHYYIEYTKINHTWDIVDAQAKIQIVQLDSPQIISNTDNDTITVVVENTFIIESVATYSTWLTGLENYTDYQIRIAGKTAAGLGPFSPTVVYRTPENGTF